MTDGDTSGVPLYPLAGRQCFRSVAGRRDVIAQPQRFRDIPLQQISLLIAPRR